MHAVGGLYDLYRNCLSEEVVQLRTGPVDRADPVRIRGAHAGLHHWWGYRDGLPIEHGS